MYEPGLELSPDSVVGVEPIFALALAPELAGNGASTLAGVDRSLLDGGDGSATGGEPRRCFTLFLTKRVAPPIIRSASSTSSLFTLGGFESALAALSALLRAFSRMRRRIGYMQK